MFMFFFKIAGNENQMERGGQTSEELQNPIVLLLVLAILFLLTLAFSIFSLVILFYNGNFMENWNHLTTFESGIHILQKIKNYAKTESVKQIFLSDIATSHSVYVATSTKPNGVKIDGFLHIFKFYVIIKMQAKSSSTVAPQ